jgi:hypothetical protein
VQTDRSRPVPQRATLIKKWFVMGDMLDVEEDAKLLDLAGEEARQLQQ